LGQSKDGRAKKEGKTPFKKQAKRGKRGLGKARGKLRKG